MSWRPQLLVTLAEPAVVGYLVRTLLGAGFIVSGVDKLWKFNATASEFSSLYGLRHPKLWLAAYIIVAWTGAVLMIMDWAAWLGAGMLAVFTMVATLIAFPFWRATGPARRAQVFAFREHVTLAAAFIMIAWQDLLLVR